MRFHYEVPIPTPDAKRVCARETWVPPERRKITHGIRLIQPKLAFDPQAHPDPHVGQGL